MSQIKRFLALFDVHYGFERRNGHKVALHDAQALEGVLRFAQDFKPHHLILGGDILDCGAISHHNKGKAGAVEGLRLLSDARDLSESFLKPLEAACASGKRYYITGNHEDWLNDLTDEIPGLSGLVDLPKLLSLPPDYEVIAQGGHVNIGKLTFIHGDQLANTDNVAKAAVTNYERNIRFGHFHTFQAYTKNSPLDYKLAKTGIAVPCLCKKGPKYGEGKPNKWVQGFNWGYVHPNGTFSDTVTLITEGGFSANGQAYSR